jgi:hypothetical protein
MNFSYLNELFSCFNELFKALYATDMNRSSVLQIFLLYLKKLTAFMLIIYIEIYRTVLVYNRF